jgi:hypothetical protein
LLGDHSEREPPDPIPNSEVKPLSADDSVAGCHAKVGNRQALYPKTQAQSGLGFFLTDFQAARVSPPSSVKISPLI